MIELQNISFLDPVSKKLVLKDVSLCFNSSRVALVGPSGSGKSSIAKVCKGLIEPCAGKLLLAGKETSPDQLLKDASIQLIYQNPFDSFTPNRPIFELLIEYICKYRKKKKVQACNDVSKLSHKLNIHPSKLHSFAHQLSGGELQRVALLRALLCEPNMIICDEILNALDYSMRDEVLELIDQYQKDYNLLVVFISHDLPTALSFCSNYIVVERGRIIEDTVSDGLGGNNRCIFVNKSFEAMEWLELER